MDFAFYDKIIFLVFGLTLAYEIVVKYLMKQLIYFYFRVYYELKLISIFK